MQPCACCGAASQAVNWALMLAGGLAQHVHTRTVASLLTAKDFSRNSRPKGMSGKTIAGGRSRRRT